MRIAYITNYDSLDVKKWSGLGYFIGKALERQGVQLIRINCQVDYTIFVKTKRKLSKLLFKKQLQIEREPSYLKALAAKAAQELIKYDYDIVFSPSSLPITYLRTTKPIVFFTDATYKGFLDLYTGNNSIASRTLKWGNRAEAMAIKKASLIFYTSDWAINNAITDYSVDRKKIRKINFGPGFSLIKSKKEIIELIKMRTRKTQLKFLFIGVDWNRKGGPSAIELVEKLNNLGIAAHLTIVGCKVPDEVKLSKCISHISFIAKSEKQGIDRLTKLYEEAHFFILPTKADCTPVVFSEAMSFGLPVITTDVGGCSSIVINGVSGFCFKESMFIEESLRSITMVNQDKSKYEALALNSFTFYSDNLSWSINGRKIIESLNELLSNS